MFYDPWYTSRFLSSILPQFRTKMKKLQNFYKLIILHTRWKMNKAKTRPWSRAMIQGTEDWSPNWYSKKLRRKNSILWPRQPCPGTWGNWGYQSSWKLASPFMLSRRMKSVFLPIISRYAYKVKRPVFILVLHSDLGKQPWWPILLSMRKSRRPSWDRGCWADTLLVICRDDISGPSSGRRNQSFLYS